MSRVDSQQKWLRNPLHQSDATPSWIDRLRREAKNLPQKFRRLKQSKPNSVIMETTNRCNLNCPFCLVGLQNETLREHGNAAHDLLTRPLGSMTPEVFQKVKAEFKDFGIQRVYLHFQGEPFVNKKAVKYAAELKASGFWVGTFTNGLAFTKKSLEELAKVEIDLIRFSVDGATEDTYQKNRVGGKFAAVVENMKYAVSVHQGKKTRLEWQFIALRNNEHEIDLARSMAESIGIHFFVKGFRETDPALTPLNPKLRSRFQPKPCTDIYKQLGVYWNGDVVPCCYDTDGKEIMGNIMRASLNDIWDTHRYRTFRRRVDEYQKHPERDPLICQTCLRWR